MDKVRFGRALGYGARHAARAVAQAVDAATAPSAGTPASAQRQPVPERPAVPRVAGPRVAAPHIAVPKITAERVAQGKHAVAMAKGAGKSVLAPVTKFSSVLWLQVTGTFYTLIALVLGQAVWRHRAELRRAASSTEAHKAYFLVVVTALFAYFAVTNFVRAWRREKL